MDGVIPPRLLATSSRGGEVSQPRAHLSDNPCIILKTTHCEKLQAYLRCEGSCDCEDGFPVISHNLSSEHWCKTCEPIHTPSSQFHFCREIIPPVTGEISAPRIKAVAAWKSGSFRATNELLGHFDIVVEKEYVNRFHNLTLWPCLNSDR